MQEAGTSERNYTASEKLRQLKLRLREGGGAENDGHENDGPNFRA